MTKSTVIDRAIAWVSPSAGVRRMRERMQFELLSGGYKGASRTRDALSGWTTAKGDSDSVSLTDLPLLRERSSDLIRNNPTACGVINTKVGAVVGTGLKLNASIDREFLGLSDDQADEIEDAIERNFNNWAESQNSDIERTLNFYEQGDLAFRSTLERGDHLVLITRAERDGWPYATCLQHIEADRCCNRNNSQDTDSVVAGIVKDGSGAPTRYQVVDGSYRDRYRKSMTWIEVPAFNETTGLRQTLHLFRKLRPGQTRGIPDLAPVIEPLKQLDRYTESELDRTVKNAMWALLVKSETGEGLAGLNDVTDWAESRKEFYGNAPVNLKGGSSGVLGLFPDDDVTSWDPNAPNTAFEAFVNAYFAMIGTALELPQEVVLKRFQSSYSASRAALLQARQFYTGRRAWLAARFCQPVHEAVLYENVASGRINLPGFLADPLVRLAYSGAEWMGDAFGEIDENKAVSAALDRVEAGFSSEKRETAALTGQDWRKVRAQRRREARNKALSPRSDRAEVPSASDLDREDAMEAMHG